VADPQRVVALSQYKIKIDGAEPSEEFTDSIVEVIVDERLNAPTMFEIRLHDPEFKWADGSVVKEGKEVEVFGGTQTNVSVGGGEITSIEGHFGQDETQLIVRGFDRSFRLHRGIKQRTFLKQTDDKIVSQIAQENGLSAEADSSVSIQHPYVLQYNETDFAFLQRRAARIGYQVSVDKTKLKFKKPDGEAAPLVAALELGKTLISFRPQRSIGEQINEVSVRGWDPKQKQAIVGQAKSATNLSAVGDGKTGGATAQSAFASAAKRVVVDSPVDAKDEADALAKGLLEELNMNFITAEGEAFAEPKIRVGTRVEIKGVGTRFGGKYYVTGVTHRFTKEEGHKVEFSTSSRRPSFLGGLTSQPDDRHRIEGVVIGVVTNNKDDELHQARVKVKFPWLPFGEGGQEEESQWARLASPMAGPDRGFLTIPEVNDEVIVAFEHGDPNRPFVVGALWNGQDKPPAAPDNKSINDIIGSDGKVQRRYWRSRLGHLISFDDNESDANITIVDKTGKNYIKILSKDNKLEVQMEGDIQVTSKTGVINLKANKDVSIESETGTVSVKAKKDFDVNVQANAKLKATQNVQIDATMNAEMKGKAKLALSSDATAELKANAKMEINGGGMLEAKGGIIKLN
jgi:phage protein D